MLSFRPLVFCLVALTLPPPGLATRVYQSKGADGSTVFSDQPSPAARQIDIDLPAASEPPATAVPKPTAAAPPTDRKAAYTTLLITEPANDSVHWFAEGPVKVQARIVPPLADGHVLVPLLDGVPQGDGVAASSFSLTDLDPGTYQLSVIVRDAQGNDVQQSPAIQFHFKRQSLNLPARKPPPRSGS